MYNVAQILAAAGVTSEIWVKEGVTVRLTAGNQLIGTYSELLRFRAANKEYSAELRSREVNADKREKAWEVHHIFEALDVDRLGLAGFSPVYEEQICVLLPAAAHHRVNSILRRANPTRLSATGSELEPAYREAYSLVGNYCGSSEAKISQELFSVFKSVLNNLVQSSPTALNTQLMKIRIELQKLESQITLEKGLHEKLIRGSSPNPLQTAGFIASMASPLTAGAAFVNPANRSVIGGAVNTLNPVNRPELTIWAKAEKNARLANQALQRRDIIAAAVAIGLGQTYFDKANLQFQKWRNGIDAAGRRAELTIGAAAVVAAMVALAAFALEATAAAGATGAQGAVVAENSPAVQRISADVARELERGVRIVMNAETLEGEMEGERIIRKALQMPIPR